jgi:hypothetical protein
MMLQSCKAPRSVEDLPASMVLCCGKRQAVAQHCAALNRQRLEALGRYTAFET